jgi:hypothetical protein
MSEFQSQEAPSQENHENEMKDEIILNADINKPEINLDIDSKNLKKGHEIVSEEENKTYLLAFSSNGDKVKILLSEQDTFPAKIYELVLSTNDLIAKCELLSNFSSAKEISEELNKSNANLNFSIKKKDDTTITLIINYSEESNQNKSNEIDLNENIIDSREMFRQLFEKYNSIKQEQEEDITQFMNRIKKIEEILAAQTKPQEQEIEGGENQVEQMEEKDGEEQERKEDSLMKEEKKENQENQESINENQEVKNEQKEADKEEVKKPNKKAPNTQKGKNAKKGNVDKNKEKGKLNGKKKNKK